MLPGEALLFLHALPLLGAVPSGCGVRRPWNFVVSFTSGDTFELKGGTLLRFTRPEDRFSGDSVELLNYLT